MGRETFMEDLASVLEVDPVDLSESFELNRDNWNSLAIVTTIVLIDEQFGATIEGDKLRECTSVGGLWQLIQNAVES